VPRLAWQLSSKDLKGKEIAMRYRMLIILGCLVLSVQASFGDELHLKNGDWFQQESVPGSLLGFAEEKCLTGDFGRFAMDHLLYDKIQRRSVLTVTKNGVDLPFGLDVLMVRRRRYQNSSFVPCLSTKCRLQFFKSSLVSLKKRR
jgi:hypothetical protein